MFIATTATRKIANMTARIRCIPGGTSASKTISVLLYLIALAQSDKKPTLTSIVSESFPHLRRGCLRDFETIMKEHAYWQDERWDKTNSIYTMETGSQIEFFSVDQGDKLRGARRDRLFINEANNTTFEAFEQLEVRTREFVILDWNPSSEFYYYTEIKPKRQDVEEITLTYKDNEALSPEIVKSIESRQNRKGWWQVYGLGKLGEIEGAIYKGWTIIDALPESAKLFRRGLDFGYTNDPSAVVSIYKYGDTYVLDEELYQKGLSNRQLADVLLSLDHTLVVADSSEPKSVDEIKSYGVPIVGVKKGKDSVRNGIQYVQDQKIFVTKKSTNIINEYRNYLWATDRDGKFITPNVPEDGFDHILDATRYALAYDVNKKRPLQSWPEKKCDNPAV